MKQISREVMLLLMLAGIILLLSIFTSGTLHDSVIDINFHFAFWVIDKGTLLSLFFLALIYIIYLVRQLRLNFTNRAVNIIFLAAAGGLLIYCTTFTSWLGTTYSYGYVIYPPLSQLTQANEVLQEEIVDYINAVKVLESFLLLSMLFTAFRFFPFRKKSSVAH